MAKFEVYNDKKGEFRFRLKASNGQVILTGQGYKAKPSCMNGIESVKKNCKDDGMFERLTATNGKNYFNLKSTNGQVIGVSQMYASVSGMEIGIESVKKNAPVSEIDE